MRFSQVRDEGTCPPMPRRESRPKSEFCPKCGFALWPTARPRRVRFHDLGANHWPLATTLVRRWCGMQGRAEKRPRGSPQFLRQAAGLLAVGPPGFEPGTNSVMSAESAQSIECRGVLPTDKPLEFQRRGGPGAVHPVPVDPSITARFGAYLVPTSEPVGRLSTVKDVAARWAVCTATVYSLAKSGRLESLRIGNSIRFTVSAVAGYEQTRVGAKAERHPDRNTHG